MPGEDDSRDLEDLFWIGDLGEADFSNVKTPSRFHEHLLKTVNDGGRRAQIKDSPELLICQFVEDTAGELEIQKV